MFFNFSRIQVVPVGDKGSNPESMESGFPDGRLLIGKTRVKLFKRDDRAEAPTFAARMVAAPTTLLTL